MLQALLLFTLHESSFSRSYGGILPSSLTRVFPRTLGFSPRHPRADLSYCVTPSIKQFILVQEFQPVVHRLRFSASA